MSEFNVFISYSSADILPTEICHKLEMRGIKCWIAPRNITPGTPYARAIMQGLINSDTFLIFISSNSLKSEDVLNEVDNAHGLKKNIVPVFIENVALTPEFSYYLKRKQWITAYDNLEGSINTIINLFGGKATLTGSIPDCNRNNNLQSPPFTVEYIFDRLKNREEKNKNDEFIFPIEDVFTITGRGTVATGRVERGIVKIQDNVEIVGLSTERKQTVVTGVEMFRKLLDQAEAGDNIGVLLRGIGGRHTPFFNGYRPQFYFRTTDVTGVIELPAGTEMVMPGDNVQMTIELITPIAIEKGLRFAIREGGRTVGSGVVAEVIE